MRKLYLFAFLFSFFYSSVFASEADSLKVWRDSVNASYSYQTGVIVLKDGLAKITVPQGYKYLDGPQSNNVLTNLWGNPPGESSLGMLFPASSGPADPSSWAIDVTYSEDGFIKDDDAKDIKYDELLSQMQSDTEEENQAREEKGYQSVQLIGWAVPPFYDAETHKLHWAKELQFGTEKAEFNTLNYNIRILGRKGYLMLNAIGDMSMLPAIKKDIPSILASVEFNEGNLYTDFDPSVDNVAAYGIGGLIAGKVLAKAGFFAIIAKFFKVFLVAAIKFWKVLALVLVALFSGIKKFFRRKNDQGETADSIEFSGEEEAPQVMTTEVIAPTEPVANEIVPKV